MVTGVPAGMAAGANEPVGEIPPLSDVAVKRQVLVRGNILFDQGQALTPRTPAQHQPDEQNGDLKSTGGVAPIPLRHLHKTILPLAPHFSTSRKLDAIVGDRFISNLV